jgi:purine-cytosine permease-like protein
VDQVNPTNGGYAVGWFTLSLINSGIAQGKNRSGLLWFFLSLFIGPVATLIIVLLPRGAPR